MNSEANKIIAFGIVAWAVVAVAAVGIYYLATREEESIIMVELPARANYLTITNLVEEEAAGALTRMILDAEADGMCIVVLDGYRTEAEQQSIIDAAKEKGTEQYVAAVGESEHHTGKAVDLGGCPMTDGKRDDNAERLELKNDFETLPEYEWMTNNAERYGFRQTYTRENESETGIPAESWHWYFTK